MTLLAVIPARAGSKGLPGKNIADLGGKPLIGWTIKAALGATCVDRSILSSDGEAIIEIARAQGCDVPFVRSADLASDTASSLDVVLDALTRVPGFTHVALLQPTSPFRTAAHIDAAWAQMQAAGAQSVVSVCETAEPPYWMYGLADGRLQPLLPLPGVTRRQDLPPAYVLNGAIYISSVARLHRTRSFVDAGTVGYVMPRAASVDIDTMDDLEAARRALQ